MPLVTANQYDLVPQFSNIGTGLAQGVQIGNQFRQNRLQDEALAAEKAQQAQISQFSQAALGGDKAALGSLAGVDPQRANQLQTFLTSMNEAERKEMLRENENMTRGALNIIKLSGNDPAKARVALQNQINEWKAQGLDTTRSEGALALDDGAMMQAVQEQASKGLELAEQAKGILMPDTLSAQQLAATNRGLDIRERELEQRRDLAFSKPDIESEVIKRKLEEEIKLKPVLEGAIAKAEGDVESSVKIIDQSFERIGKIQSNISNLDRAVSALDRGANTGAIQKFMPSIKAASRELKQIQNELGLDVIGAVSFGALSEGELNLALDTAIDLGQEPESLKQMLIDKKAAQQKLVSYLNEQIQFLDSGGTIAGWSEKVNKSKPNQPGQATQGSQKQGGQVMVDGNGNRAIVYPDGTFEEL